MADDTIKDIDEADLLTEDEDDLFDTMFNDTSETITTASDDELPIHRDLAEEAVLSMMMHDDEIAEYIITQSGLTADYFLKRKNRLLYPIILSVRYSKGASTLDFIEEAIEGETLPDGQPLIDHIGGWKELGVIEEATPTVIDFRVAEGYVQIVKDRYRLSKMKEEANWLVSQTKFDDLKFSEALSRLQGIIAETSSERGLVPLDVLTTEMYARHLDRKENPEKYRPIPTGFYFMDTFGVVQRKCLAVFGANTNVGKTIIVGNMITPMLLSGYKVVLFTPEVDNLEFMDRLICAESGVPLDDWKAGIISENDYHKIGTVQTKFIAHANNLFIDDKGSQTTSYILNSLRRHMISHKVDVVVVDYLQGLTPESAGRRDDARRQQVNDAMNRFRAFAKENDIAFIVVSQLRRSRDEEPQIQDLKESGDIENIADAVVLLHRFSETNIIDRKKGWYRIVKNRHGRRSETVLLEYNEDILKFTEAETPDKNSIEDEDIDGQGHEDTADDEQSGFGDIYDKTKKEKHGVQEG